MGLGDRVLVQHVCEALVQSLELKKGVGEQWEHVAIDKQIVQIYPTHNTEGTLACIMVFEEPWHVNGGSAMTAKSTSLQWGG